MKPKKTFNNDGPQIDYDFIAEQVEDGMTGGVVTGIMDLGIQPGTRGCSYASKQGDEERYMEFDTVDDAQTAIEEMQELVSEKVIEKLGLDEVEQTEEGKFRVEFELYDAKARHEIAIWLDLPDILVAYIEGEEEKPYRALMNNVFKGEMKGISTLTTNKLKTHNLKTEKPYTYDSKNMIHKLAKFTGNNAIVDGSDDASFNDTELLLGGKLMVNVEKNNSFINVTPAGKLMKGYEPDELPDDIVPIEITFEGATLEQLIIAKPRFSILKKIKAAENYEGSQMQAAITAYEEYLKEQKAEPAEEKQEEAPKKVKKAKGKDKAKKSDSEEAAPKKAGKTKKAPKSNKPPVVMNEGDDDGDDDDVPF